MKFLLLTALCLLVSGCEKTIHEASVPRSAPPLACALS